VEPEVAGLIDFSSLDLGGIEPVDLDIQNAYSSWLSEGNTGSLSDFQAATSETTPTDLTDAGGADHTDTGTIAPPGLLAEAFDPKPMIGLAPPKTEMAPAPAVAPEAGIRATPFAPLFVEKATEYGISPRYLDRTAAVESRYDPNAQNPRSSAGGLFQFINGTARDYNLTNRFDPVQATDAAARLARDNAATLKNALGRDPTDGELYLAHQQGAGGAIKILSNPDAPMESLVGSEAARLNGGAGLTGSQFAQKFISKIESGASAFAPTANAGRAPQPYEDRMASIGAQRLPSDGFDGSRLPNVQNVDTTQAERPGLLGDLLSPKRAIPGGQAPLSNFNAIPGAIDPAFTYQDGPRALPRAPEPTARDMVAGARTGGARSTAIARDNRADNPAVRSATVSTTGGRALNPVMQEDLSNAPDGGARQFAAMEASRGGPFSMLGGGQEAPQAATGSVAPAAAGDAPAAGSAPVQSASGGATAAPASGGGWKMSDTMSDFFMALGSSLLSSPKGRPLQNFGQAFNALTVASQDRQKTAGQVNATALLLRRAGVPEADIPVLSIDPKTAAGYLDQMRAMKAQADEAAFTKQLYGSGAGAGAAPSQPSASPPVTAAGTPAPSGAPVTPQAQTGGETQAPPAPAADAERQRVRAEIANFERMYRAAPSDKMREQVKFEITRRENRLKELGDPLDREAKQLDVESKRRALSQVDPPKVQVVKQPDGSEVALQWDGASGTFIPLKAPAGGNNVGAGPTNPYALPGKPTEDQSKSAGFATRMAEAETIVAPIEAIGTDKTQAALNNLPFGVNNLVISKDRQKYNQAKENFITAVLRKESGAVIGDQEFAREERKYFPVPGEGPEIIEQKRKSRQNAIRSMMGAAGSGYKLPESTGLEEKASDKKAPGASDVLADARAAIARGAPKDAVVKRLRDAGIDPTGL